MRASSCSSRAGAAPARSRSGRARPSRAGATAGPGARTLLPRPPPAEYRSPRRGGRYQAALSSSGRAPCRATRRAPRPRGPHTTRGSRPAEARQQGQHHVDEPQRILLDPSAGRIARTQPFPPSRGGNAATSADATGRSGGGTSTGAGRPRAQEKSSLRDSYDDIMCPERLPSTSCCGLSGTKYVSVTGVVVYPAHSCGTPFPGAAPHPAGHAGRVGHGPEIAIEPVEHLAHERRACRAACGRPRAPRAACGRPARRAAGTAARCEVSSGIG